MINEEEFFFFFFFLEKIGNKEENGSGSTNLSPRNEKHFVAVKFKMWMKNGGKLEITRETVLVSWYWIVY